jgi:CHAT domain-containing protein/Flp pilus assembly protein TadD
MIAEFGANNYLPAIEHGEIARNILKEKPEFISEYTGLISNLAFLYMETGQYNIAETYYKEVLEIIRPILGNDHIITARTRNNLGENYLKAGDNKKARKFLTQAYFGRKKLLAPLDPEYIQSLKNLSRLEEGVGNIEAAIAYRDTISQIYTENSDTNRRLHALNDKALLLSRMSFHKEAEALYSVLLKEDNELKQKPDKSSLTFIRNAALNCKQTGNYKKAIYLFEQLCDKTEEVSEDKRFYLSAISELGVLYYESGEYKKALAKYEQAKSLAEMNHLTGSETYLDILNNLAVLYYSSGVYTKAEQYYAQARDSIFKYYGSDNLQAAKNLNGRAVLHSENGNINRAEELFRQAQAIHKMLNDTHSDDYYALLFNLADLYVKKELFSKAAAYYSSALRLADTKFGENSLERLKIEYRIAGFFSRIGMYSEADSLYKVVLTKQAETLGTSHPDYAVSLDNYGSLKLYRQDYKAAEKLFEEAAETEAMLYGKEHWRYAVVLNNLAALYYEKGRLRKAGKYFMQANQQINRKIREVFSFMGSNDTEAFLHSVNYLYDAYNSYYFIRQKTHPKYAAYLMNNVFYRKALLLQYEKNRRLIIMQNESEDLRNDFNNLLKVKEKLGKIYLSSEYGQKDSLAAYREKMRQLEKSIREKSTDYNTADKNMNTYKAVQTALSEKEALIEFVRFRYYDIMPTDSFFYCALVLKPDSKYPELFYLFEESELQRILKRTDNIHEHKYIARLYHRKAKNEFGYKPESDSLAADLYRLIWKPLEPALEKIERIWYSPAGLLHKVSFAALSDNDSRHYLSDRYEMRLLAHGNGLKDISDKPLELKRASLYGNINYDTPPDEIAQVVSEYVYDAPDYWFGGKLYSSLRDEAWAELSGTKQEVEKVAELLQNIGCKTDIYQLDKAVEESIKQYKKQHLAPDILHIATHGFFYGESQQKAASELELSGSVAYKYAENPLFRSGLLFAGANRSWNDLEMPEFAEDGIFTAYEASNLNLINTKLAVLSACETGLGDLSRYEGVYGLQRAFKIAGSDKIIMSLWKIPDEQTVELMSSFYDFLTDDLPVKDAFYKAQNKMKKKYLPYYWAAFVLLE